jgi:hypothetical protein
VLLASWLYASRGIENTSLCDHRLHKRRASGESRLSLRRVIAHNEMVPVACADGKEGGAEAKKGGPERVVGAPARLSPAHAAMHVGQTSGGRTAGARCRGGVSRADRRAAARGSAVARASASAADAA